MPVVRMPNGDQVKFPDDMPKSQIKALILKKFPQVGGAEKAQQTNPIGVDLPIAGVDFDPSDPSVLEAKQKARDEAREKALNEAYGEMDLGQRIGTFAENTLEGVPIAGPLVQRGADFVLSETLGRAQGYDPKVTREVLERNRNIRESRAPVTAVAGNLTGATMAMGKLAQTQVGKQALGIEGKNAATRYATGIGTNAAISSADTLARNGTAKDAAGSAIISGTATALMPGVGATLRALKGKAAEAKQFLESAINPKKAAASIIARAKALDDAAMPGGLLNQADEHAARLNEQPVLNVDRGGETTRALARSAANQSPEFRGQMEKAVSDRFEAQGQRAVKTLTRIAGGNVDDIQYQNNLKEMARISNRPAYDKAYAAKEAQSLWNDEFARIMQSPAVKRAARTAETSGANRSVSEGISPVKNPFVFGRDGSVSLAVDANGVKALPNLRFWDQVQRDLRKQAESAGRGSAKFNEIEAVRKTLNNALDNAVPAFKQARVGAAGFFGAENALEAGKKFAKNLRLVPEAKQAFGAMNKAEQQAFKAGYTSDIVDAIKASGDRRNIIQSKFGSTAARELNEFVLGKSAARELEAFVRVEHIMDQMRGALGNSSTTRQLVEMGLVGGAGTGAGFASGQDWQTSVGIGMLLAAGKGGAAKIGANVDERVMKEIGRILLSNDPALISKLQFNAANSPKWLKGLEAYTVGLEKALPVTAGSVAAQ